MRYAIYGAGGFGREVATFLADGLAQSGRDTRIVFVSDDGPANVMGVDVLRFNQLRRGDRLALAVGDGAARERLERLCLDARYELASLVARSARVTERAEIGPGAIFSDFTMVTAPAKIGRQFQCNIYSYVAHDCVIGDYVTFAPRVNCNGNVTVGDYAYIGTGAFLRQGITIGARAIIGMGAVVVKDVPEGTTVMGNPAR